MNTINDYVKVKLTNTGKKLLQEYIDVFNTNVIKNYPHSQFRMTMLYIDNEGLVELQL